MSDRTVTVAFKARDDGLGRFLRESAKDARALSGAVSRDLGANAARGAAGFGALATGAANARTAVTSLAGRMRDALAVPETGRIAAAWRGMAGAATAAGDRVRTAWGAVTSGASRAVASVAAFGDRVNAASLAAQAASGRFDGLASAGQRFAIAGAASVAAFVSMVAPVARFDQAMSRVAMGTGAAGTALDGLRSAILDLSNADLGFGPTQAADAVTELGKAGVKTAEITGGALKGALALAAAGTMDVGEAAETAASAMTQFGLSGRDVPHIADLLAAGANKAQGSVHDLGMALKQSGLVAAAVGLSIEEATGSLAAFASAGLIGSDAGTSLKTMLQRLTPTSREAATEMQKLGLSAYDSQGNFIGIANYAELLKKKLGGLTTEQRNASMAIMFGSDAVRAANVLYAEGADGIQHWIDNVNDQGAAARAASTLTDNLIGDLAKFKAAVETNLIQNGSGTNSILRTIVQDMTAFAGVVGSVPAPLLVLGGAALIMGGSVMMIVPKVAAANAALIELGIISEASAAKMSGAFKGVVLPAAIAVGVATLATALSDYIGRASVATVESARLADAMSDLGRGAQGGDEFMRVMSANGIFLSKSLSSNADALDRFASSASANTGILGKFNNVLNHMDASRFDEQIKRLDKSLTEMAEGGKAEEAAAAFKRMMDAAQQAGADVGELKGRFETYAPAAKLAAESQTAAAEAARKQAAHAREAAGGVSALTSEEYKLADAAGQNAAKHKELLDALGALNSQLLGLRGAEVGYQDAVDRATDSLAKHGLTLDIDTEAGRANRTALDNVAASAGKQMKSMLESGKSVDQVTAFAKTATAQFVDMAKKMGMNGDEALALARDLGLTEDQVRALSREIVAIPKQVGVKIDVDTRSAAAATVSLRNQINALYDKTVTISVIRRDYGNIAGVTGIGGFDAGYGQYATGGYVTGPGTGTSDDIVARLSNGEFVIRAAMVDRYGVDYLQAINAGLMPLQKFATGGLVSQQSVVKSRDLIPPSYMSMMGAGSGRSERGVSVSVTNNYPVAEPASVTTNRALQQVAALGM